MKKYLTTIILLYSSTLLLAIDAMEIIRKADNLMRGKSSYFEMTLTIERPAWQRTIALKGWSISKDYSLIYITAPAKEKGQVFLKRDKEMWNWVPSIERTIKIPPSMMMQSWLGSDMTNDDILKESSIVDDYTHTLAAEDKKDNYDCYKIEMRPKEDAAVVWGKIILWITKDKYLKIRGEYYDEDNLLVNLEKGSEIKKMHDREIPTVYEIIPQDADKKGQRTILKIENIKFDLPLEKDFFSLQNIKKVK